MTRSYTPSSFLQPSMERLSDVLKKLYVVPDYQRDYSWTKNEFNDFWEDISSLANKSFTNLGTIVPKPKPHFLGAIVLQHFPDDIDRPIEVMDGQQRLVTSSIFFSVLHEFCSLISDLDMRKLRINSIESMLLTYSTNNIDYHLCLARDQIHFKEMVCERLTLDEKHSYFIENTTTRTPKGAVINRIMECADYFHQEITKYLDGLQASDRDIKLNNLLISSMDLCLVLEMRVLEHGVAYEVFESLNARGLDLQQADLLKNKFFAISEGQGTKSHVSDAWDQVVRSVQQQSMINLNEFFYFYTIAKYHFLKQSSLFSDVIELVSTNGHSPLGYMLDAAKCAENLQIVLEGGLLGLERDVISLRDFITNKFSLTMIIAGISRYPISSPEFAEIIKLTHHYVFRRFIIEGLSVGKYANEITEVAREFSNSKLADIHALRTKFGTFSRDSVFIDKFQTYCSPNNKVGFYVLEMIENYLTNDAGTVVKRQSYNQHLEHIMPKKPTLRDWPSVVNDDKYEEFVNRIGNLLILEGYKNKHIKNKAFSFKNLNTENLDYQNSKLTFPKSAQKYLINTEWNFESIESRQKDLVNDYALKVWDL